MDQTIYESCVLAIKMSISMREQQASDHSSMRSLKYLNAKWMANDQRNQHKFDGEF